MDIEERTDKKYQKRDKQKKQKMKVSGGQVKKLQKIIKNK